MTNLFLSCQKKYHQLIGQMYNFMGSIFDDVTKTKIMDTAEVLKTEVPKKGKNSPIFLLEMLENRIKLNSAN